MVNARAVLGALWLLCPGASLGLDDVALVQGAVRAELGPTSTLVKQAEQVLQTVGSLEMHTRPTQTDKEALMMAQALLKNPGLIQFYMPPPPKLSAADVKVSSSASSKHTTSVGSSQNVSKPKSVSKPENVSKPANASKHHTPRGNCSKEDRVLMEELGAGSGAGNFPGIVASCGKKAFGFSGLNSKSFMSCLDRDLNGGLDQKCGECFLHAAAHGVRHCAMKCMTSWCSKGCLDCSQSYRATTLLKCVGFASPEASACR